ncbi:hypothetical protein [Haemophilus influenzae]|uniref:Uncharacterized protein n=1 Tax=Haemophilus influenzae TaxID=727 RepID=A0AAX3IRS5_HAEIF|nr:hypothetical protein [Haemophilus influenzae]RFN96294.1 hypothetical protein CH638_03515 [Haemophilus influenzae]VTX59720.1 Uncharacterised protein [Haemophilus influenzae]
MNINTFLPFSSHKTTYDNVLESFYLLSVYEPDLKILQAYLNRRIQSSQALANILNQLNADLTVAIKKATQDVRYLNAIKAFDIVDITVKDNPAGRAVIPWHFFSAPSICSSVLNRTHPLIKLYDKYRYLFLDIVESDRGTLYLSRNLF